MFYNKQKLIFTMTIFGTIGLVRRGIPYSSTMIALGRGITAVIFLIFWTRIQKREPDWEGIRNNRLLLILSGALIGFNWILLFEAYRYTSISGATVCYYMAPIFMILASPIFLSEAITKRKAICAAAALFGMVLVSGVLEREVTGTKGILYGLGAAVLYAMVIILNKKLKPVNATDQTTVQLGAASIALLPYFLLTENLPSLQWDGKGVLLLLIAGIIHTGFAYALYFGSIEGVPTQTVAILSYIDPIVALLLSALILHEKMNVPSAIGVVLVIGAALTSEVDFDKLFHVKQKNKRV